MIEPAGGFTWRKGPVYNSSEEPGSGHCSAQHFVWGRSWQPQLPAAAATARPLSPGWLPPRPRTRPWAGWGPQKAEKREGLEPAARKEPGVCAQRVCVCLE